LAKSDIKSEASSETKAEAKKPAAPKPEVNIGMVGHVDCKDPQVKQHNAIDDGDYKEYAWTLHSGKAPQTEYDHSFILANDLNRLR